MIDLGGFKGYAQAHCHSAGARRCRGVTTHSRALPNPDEVLKAGGLAE